MKDAVKQVGDKFLIPIKIENLSDKTPAKAIFLINVISNGTNESHPFEIEYLSRHSAKVMYWSYDKDPSELEIKIELKSYQF